MKVAIVSVLAAAALTLGACATTAEESAALTPDQMKAELAAVSQEILEIDSWVRGQFILGRDVRSVMQDRAVAGRLTGLVHRQLELRDELAEAGYPRTAEEVRERIVEIDQILAKQDASLAPVGSSGMASSLRTLVSFSGVPGSASPRSLAWQRTYKLQEERDTLHARLQTLEQSDH